jgi:hypothetical protein
VRQLNAVIVLLMSIMMWDAAAGNSQLPVSGTLVYVSDNLLYYYDFSTVNGPQLVSEEQFAVGEIFAVAPDRSYIVLGQWIEDGDYNLVKFDLVSKQLSTMLTYVPTGASVDFWREQNEQFIWILGWSPDQNWLLGSVGTETYVMSVDDQMEPLEIPRGLIYWTADSMLLVEERNVWSLVDPANGESQNLSLATNTLPNPADDIAAYQQAFEEMLAAQGISLAERSLPPIRFNASTDFDIEPGAPLKGEYCREWRIVMQDSRTGESLDIYQTATAAVISNVTQVGDSQLLYLQARYENCETGVPIGELVRLTGELEPEVLAEGLISAADDDVQFGHIVSKRFLVSPEETHVLYLHHDRYGLEPNQAMLLDLTTLEEQPVEGLTGIDVMEWFTPISVPGT